MIASSRLACRRVAAAGRRGGGLLRSPVVPSRGLATDRARLGARHGGIATTTTKTRRDATKRALSSSGNPRDPSIAERIREILSPLSSSAAKLSSSVPWSWVSERWAAHTASSSLARTAALALAGLVGARFAYTRLLQPEDRPPRRQRRRDESRVTVLMPTPRETTTEDHPAASAPMTREDLLRSATRFDGRDLREIDAEEFGSFVRAQRVTWERLAREKRGASAATLRRELEEALSDARSERVRKFADWYFAYPTTYQLMGIALSSATKHALTLSRRKEAMTERVVADLQDHIGRKYEALVLRPAITDARIHRAFVRTLREAHGDYCAALRELEGTIADYVIERSEPYTSAAPQPTDVAMDLDWPTQLQKVEHVHLTYEKNPEILSAALIGGGAAIGKLAGGTAMTGAAKAVAGKLAAPFATKAVGSALGGKAASAAAAGAIVAGPAGAAVGAATGAAIGVGVDMTVNAGVALMQRSAFEKDIRDSLDATRLEWEDRLLPELERVQSIWYNHALSILSTPKPNTMEAVPEATPTTAASPIAVAAVDTMTASNSALVEAGNTNSSGVAQATTVPATTAVAATEAVRSERAEASPSLSEREE